jgi:hypothetical protein
MGHTASSLTTQCDTSWIRVSRELWVLDSSQPKEVGWVHSGFLSSWTAVRSEVLGNLKSLIMDLIDDPELVNPALPGSPVVVYCTGHSLGGALAMLCAYELSCELEGIAEIHMDSFGSPRVGNPGFTKQYDRMVPESYRVVCDRDIVTSIPNWMFSYKHSGLEIVVDKQGVMVLNS